MACSAVTRRIGILVTGRPSSELAADHGDYFSMFSNLLSAAGGEAEPLRLEFERIAVEDGEQAPPGGRRLDDYAGFLITGSKHDAHDTSKPWIQQLHHFVREAHARRTLLLGVCFGHQLIAAALGGRSGRADAVGWEVGMRTVRPRPAWRAAHASSSSVQLGRLVDALTVAESHRDQVTELPPGADWVAESDRCPYEIFTVQPNVLCIQGHPEFSPGFLSGLIRARRALNSFDDTVANDALASVAKMPASTAYFRQLMRGFLLGRGIQF